MLYEDLSSEEGLDGRLEKLSAIYDIYGVDSDHMMEDWLSQHHITTKQNVLRHIS